MKMRIWRIETAGGEGCYTSGLVDRAAEEIGDDIGSLVTDHRPGPVRDPGIGRSLPVRYYYGFASEKQMEDWFGLEMLGAMHDLGARLCLYEAEEVVQGHFQVAFIKEGAALIEIGDLV